MQDYYRDADGTATGEEANYRSALRPLRGPVRGGCPAAPFSPKKLKAVREEMIMTGISPDRHQPPGQSKIRHMFRWGVAEEFVPVTVSQVLDGRPRAAGRAGAKPRAGAGPRRWPRPRDFAAVLPYLQGGSCGPWCGLQQRDGAAVRSEVCRLSGCRRGRVRQTCGHTGRCGHKTA